MPSSDGRREDALVKSGDSPQTPRHPWRQQCPQQSGPPVLLPLCGTVRASHTASGCGSGTPWLGSTELSTESLSRPQDPWDHGGWWVLRQRLDSHLRYVPLPFPA